MTHNGQTINYVYDAGNKLLQAGNTTFTYDGNGNMVSKTENGQTTTYVYNYEDKMIQVNLPNGSSIVYSYDHSGKRIAKTAGGTTIDYYFDGDDLIAEAQGASILAYYTQGQGLISQRRNNASYFYHYDGLGSTKALTDANQNIPNTTKYDAWGNILQAFGTITNPYLYVGELGYYGDGDVEMYLLTQRWYNPVVGRFVVRDPSDKEENLFVYCRNNSANFVDPKGLQSGWYVFWWSCVPSPFPLATWQDLQKCLYNCAREGAFTWPPNRQWLGCLARCYGEGKITDLVSTLVCCLIEYFIRSQGGGAVIGAGPYLNACLHPGSTYGQECCQFKYCKCLVSRHPRQWWTCYTGLLWCFACAIE